MNYRKWKTRTRVIIVLVTIVIFFVLGIAKGHAEETVAAHIKEVVDETLVGGVAAYGAMESAVMRNLGMGLALGAIASREFTKAYEEAIADWDRYQSYDDTNRNKRDISPAEANIEHRRD